MLLRSEIEIAFAFRVPHILPLAAHEADRIAGVVRNNVLLELLDGVLTGSSSCGIQSMCLSKEVRRDSQREAAQTVR